jgi:hypothetical protein
MTTWLQIFLLISVLETLSMVFLVNWYRNAWLEECERYDQLKTKIYG